nr:MAG TPA: hypothetical protein [Caudoviricetes sp.]
MEISKTVLNEDFIRAMDIYNKGYDTETFKILNDSTISTYGYNNDSNIGKKGTKLVNVIPSSVDNDVVFTIEVFELVVKDHKAKTGDKVKSFEIIIPVEDNIDVLLNIKTLEHYIITPDTFYYLNLLSNLDKASKEPRRINSLDDIERIGMPIDSDGNDGIKFFLPTNNI